MSNENDINEFSFYILADGTLRCTAAKLSSDKVRFTKTIKLGSSGKYTLEQGLSIIGIGGGSDPNPPVPSEKIEYWVLFKFNQNSMTAVHRWQSETEPNDTETGEEWPEDEDNEANIDDVSGGDNRGITSFTILDENKTTLTIGDQDWEVLGVVFYNEGNNKDYSGSNCILNYDIGDIKLKGRKSGPHYLPEGSSPNDSFSVLKGRTEDNSSRFKQIRLFIRKVGGVDPSPEGP